MLYVSLILQTLWTKKKNIFLLFNLFLLFEQEVNSYFQRSFTFCRVLKVLIFIRSLLRSILITLKQELQLPILEFWYFFSRPCSLFSSSLIHLNMFYIEFYVPFYLVAFLLFLQRYRSVNRSTDGSFLLF